MAAQQKEDTVRTCEEVGVVVGEDTDKMSRPSKCWLAQRNFFNGRWPMKGKERLYITYLLVIAVFLVYVLFANSYSQHSEAWKPEFYQDKRSATGRRLYGRSPLPKEPLPMQFLQKHGPQTDQINCRSLFNGSDTEVAKAKDFMESHPRKSISNGDYLALTENCKRFQTVRGYTMEPLSQEESDFPLAYTILMYKEVEQVERLLRAIYMPQNYYCIHIDAKLGESEMEMKAMRRIAGCFPNVFIASKLERVYWGHISILTAEMKCLDDLRKYQWKYYINLSGQMFPLQTNNHLVKILTLYNGANDVEGSIKRKGHWSVVFRQNMKWTLVESLGSFIPAPLLKTASVPHNLTIHKGSNQVVATRAFIYYAFYSRVGQDFMEWLKDTQAPDEYFLPTMNHDRLLRAPGGYSGDPENKAFTARASIWMDSHGQMNWSWDKWDCRGKWVHHICILGVGDLPWTAKRPELFLNKVHLDYEPLTLGCLEELIYNRTIAGDKYPFDPTYYNNLDIVKHREFVNVKKQEEES